MFIYKYNILFSDGYILTIVSYLTDTCESSKNIIEEIQKKTDQKYTKKRL